MCANDKNGNIALPYVVSSLPAASSKPNSPKSQQITNIDKQLSTQSVILKSSRCGNNSSNFTSSVLDKPLAHTTLAGIVTADSEITNVPVTTHSEQTTDERKTIDTVTDNESISESPKSLSRIRELVNNSEHYFKDYIGSGVFNRLDKNEIVFNDYQLLSILKKQVNFIYFY